MQTLYENIFFIAKEFFYPLGLFFVYSLEELFSYTNLPYKELFSEAEALWDPLKQVFSYLEAFFNRHPSVDLDSMPGVYLSNPKQVFVGKGSKISPGVSIEGAAIIGENSIIRPFAYIRGGVIVGDGCLIGHGTEVKHSILLNSVEAAHFNYIGDSIVGNGVSLGAGVKLANVRFDRRSISISYGEKRVNTGLGKLGALIGDKTQIGCNAVTNPGTIIGRGCLCYPCSLIDGVLPSLSIYQ